MANDTTFDASNGNYSPNKTEDYDSVKNYSNEQYMNSVNSNSITTNGSTTTTIIADIEGEVKKKKFPSDKTYYIAKEILLTELTYKKDLDVINVVSFLLKTFFLKTEISPYFWYICFIKFMLIFSGLEMK